MDASTPLVVADGSRSRPHGGAYRPVDTVSRAIGRPLAPPRGPVSPAEFPAPGTPRLVDLASWRPAIYRHDRGRRAGNESRMVAPAGFGGFDTPPHPLDAPRGDQGECVRPLDHGGPR